MSDPLLLAVDDDADALREIEATLRDRYGRHYRVACTRSPGEARALLEELATAGDDVALVLASEGLDGMTGSELLAEARRLHPHAKRSLLIAWGDWGIPATGEAIFAAIAEGRTDGYVIRPSPPPDELFHNAISGMLLEWAESQRVSPYTIHVIGETWSGRAYELRELLGRCAMPHAFSLADSTSGRALVDGTGDDGGFPMVIFPDGTVLWDPTNSEIIEATGSPVDPPSADFDLVIVGAGPAGLSAAVYGASEGFDTLVVDEGGIGGQATSSSLIRNYLGFPRGVSGRRLAQSAYEQAWVFGAHFTFLQRITGLERDDDGGLLVRLVDSGAVRTRAVLLATGATYQLLGIPELEALNGAGVFYGGTASEAPGMIGREVYVVGGANSAGQAALHLTRFAARVTLVVRAESLTAGMSQYLVQQVEATPNLTVLVGTEVVGGGGDGHLDHLVLRDRASGYEETVAADGLFLMIGASPHTDWLPPEIERDDRGFVLTGPDLSDARWTLDRRPFLLETSMPGVFAAGDARRGSVKRVASAVGEGSVAIQTLHQLFEVQQLEPRGRARNVLAVTEG